MADGLAMMVFMRDLKKSYMRNTKLKSEEYFGFEAALEEEALQGSEKYMQAKQYYADLFAGVEVSETMPPTKLEKGLVDQKGVFITHYEPMEKGKIDIFCKEQGISKNTLFTAAFGMVLQKFQHIEQAVFSTIHNGRNSKEKMNAFCMFTQTLPVVMPAKEIISELLVQLEKQLNENKEHTSYSFIELCEEYGISSDFQFAYQGKVVDQVSQKYVLPGGTICNQIKNINQSTASAFTMQVMREDTDGYRFEVEYKENLYHKEWVESFIASYEAALIQLMEKKKIDEMDLFCQQYHGKPLYADSGMEEEYRYDNTDETILSVLEKRRNEQPEHLYVVCEEHAYHSKKRGHFWNIYGPTKCTTYLSRHKVDGAYSKVSLGKVNAWFKVYVVDEKLRQVSYGAIGELLIVGDCVGKGYMGMPKETKEKFVQFQGKPAYHSGDLAYWRKDGKIAFLGRMDQQVKLRGLRVELGEIETVLCTFPDIQASIVVVRGEGTSRYLCGYFTET